MTGKAIRADSRWCCFATVLNLIMACYSHPQPSARERGGNAAGCRGGACAPDERRPPANKASFPRRVLVIPPDRTIAHKNANGGEPGCKPVRGPVPPGRTLPWMPASTPRPGTVPEQAPACAHVPRAARAARPYCRSSGRAGRQRREQFARVWTVAKRGARTSTHMGKHRHGSYARPGSRRAGGMPIQQFRLRLLSGYTSSQTPHAGNIAVTSHPHSPASGCTGRRLDVQRLIMEGEPLWLFT